jgi:hypothetical protein
MMYTSEPKFVPIMVRGTVIWIDYQSFDGIARYRKERIFDGRRYNNGPLIYDQYADIGAELIPNGSVTVWEITVFAESEYEMKDMFGSGWSKPLEGESRPNPIWK